MGQVMGRAGRFYKAPWGSRQGSIGAVGRYGAGRRVQWGAMGRYRACSRVPLGSIGFNGALWGSRQGAIGFNGALWGAPGGSRSRARSCPNARLRFRSVPSSRAFSPRSPRRASPNSKAAPNPAPHTAPHSSANRSAAQRPMAVLGGGGGGGPPRGRDPLGGGYTAPPAGRGGNCSAS